MHRSVELRPAAADDLPSLRELFCVEHAQRFAHANLPAAPLQQLLHLQFTARETQYRAEFPAADFDVVLHNSKPVGNLYALRGPDRFVLIDICLRPEVRGRGIGGQLVQDLVTLARAANMPLSAHVMLDSKAWRLWQRLGFRDLGNDGVYRRIEVSPDPESTQEL
jgi:GNAT superfamily N-acetyltransferase